MFGKATMIKIAVHDAISVRNRGLIRGRRGQMLSMGLEAVPAEVDGGNPLLHGHGVRALKGWSICLGSRR